MKSLSQNDISRFWGKVDKEKSTTFYNGIRCWEWIAHCHRSGYGQFWLHGKMRDSHRIAYQIEFGEIQNGLWVLHHCDNPPCVNPSHLFLGTRQDNVDDREKKGRNVVKCGEDHVLSKLTKSDVDEIRRRCDAGESQLSVSKDFCIGTSQTNRIVKRKSWK